MTTIITRIIPGEKKVWVSSIQLKHLDEFRSDGWQVFYEKEGQSSIIEKAVRSMQEKTLKEIEFNDLQTLLQ